MEDLKQPAFTPDQQELYEKSTPYIAAMIQRNLVQFNEGSQVLKEEPHANDHAWIINRIDMDGNLDIFCDELIHMLQDVPAEDVIITNKFL